MSQGPRTSCWTHSEVRRRPGWTPVPGRPWPPSPWWRGPRSSGICCSSAGPVRRQPRLWSRGSPGAGRCHSDPWPVSRMTSSQSLTPRSPSPPWQGPRSSCSPWWRPPGRWSPWPGPGCRNSGTSAPPPGLGSSLSPSQAGPRAASGASALFGNVSSTNLKWEIQLNNAAGFYSFMIW